MKIDDLNLGAETISAILALALKVELNSKLRFRATRSLDELIELLKISQTLGYEDIKAALEKFTTSLTLDQQGFFRTLGIDTQPTTLNSMSYRGKTVATASPSKPAAAEGKPEGSQGKRKVMYRGQVHWI